MELGCLEVNDTPMLSGREGAVLTLLISSSCMHTCMQAIMNDIIRPQVGVYQIMLVSHLLSFPSWLAAVATVPA
jgi:hypothetical protein